MPSFEEISTGSLRFQKSLRSKVGYAPDNKFQFVISPPNGMNHGLGSFGIPPGVTQLLTKGIGELLAFSCKSITIPSSAFNVHQFHLNGKQYNTPLNRDYDPVKAEFYLDSNHLIYHFFEAWQDLIQNTTNRSRGYYDDFVSKESHVFCFDEEYNLFSPAQDYIFTNMWVHEIHEITYDWESENRWQILPVTFQIERCDTAMALDLRGQLSGLLTRTLRSVITE